MNPLLGQIGDIWKGTSFTQRLIFIVVIAGFLVGFLGVTYWIREPDYGFLYGDLDQKEAAEIVSYLRDNDIPYKVKNKGSTIMVPSNLVYEARMDLAKDSLPRGEVGFELFDEVKFGMSNLAQKVNYRRALQGELTKTISHLDGVEWAKVQIVIPEPSLFIEDEKPSTASVILKTRSGQRLKPMQISGITYLVSASVEGLSPENVTITDSLGNLLTKTEGSTMAGVVADQLELRRKMEDYYAAKALSLVERITGSGKAIVKVSADLDFKQVDEKHIEYDQDRKVPINQTITSQSTEMPQVLNKGEDDSQVENSKEKEETETTQYALSKIERAVSERAASVKRLTVAVLVDGYYEEEKTEEGKINRKFTKRPDEELKRIAAIVKQSIGLDESPPRNDKFEIQCVQFRGQVPVFIDEEGIAREKKKEFILTIVKNSSLIIAVLAFLLFAMRALKRLLGPRQQVGYAAYAPPPELQDGSVGEEGSKKLGQDKTSSERRLLLRDDILDKAKADPRTISALIKKWLRGAK
ncbi:MAG: flagellar basal-body MS-ring/collar protein FliF [Candidatus Scalinduaceae bacterium]